LPAGVTITSVAGGALLNCSGTLDIDCVLPQVCRRSASCRWN
jgi:hypothetical protein